MMKSSTVSPAHLATFAVSPSRPLRIALAVAVAFAVAPLHAQDAKSIVSAAVQRELAADREDHTAYQYRDRDITPDHDTLYYTVETPQGTLRKKLEDHGHPLSAADRQADQQRINILLADPAAQSRARKDASHDDGEAEQMLRLLPQAFLWTVTNESGDIVTLDFKPDPNFSPSGFESKVLSAMGGQITVDRSENRIRSIKGTLLDDVTFFLGIGGRLHRGGSFEVQRREIVPGHWQMTESKVHIGGRALFFKSIGSQEDEFRSDFKPSNAQTLQQANEILNQIH
jgi:hypothetical protein